MNCNVILRSEVKLHEDYELAIKSNRSKEEKMIYPGYQFGIVVVSNKL